MKILIVEDDQIIGQEIKKMLEKWGFNAYLVEDFTQVLAEFEKVDPQLVLMDVTLPCYNGYHWCSQIRNQSTVPIIFISSRSDSMDMVMAMQMGADDFVQKPIDLNLLLAKIQALLRRTYEFNSKLDELVYHDVRLNLAKSELEYSGKTIELTTTELLILEALFKEPESYIKRDKIMENCWQGTDFIDDNTLSVNISRLRKKLSDIGLEDFIETKKKYGYRINLDQI